MAQPNEMWQSDFIHWRLADGGDVEVLNWLDDHSHRAGRMHHLGIGRAHARKRVLAFADDHQVTVAELATGEVLSVHLRRPTVT